MDYTQNTPDDIAAMLDAVGLKTLDDLFSVIPEPLRHDHPLDLPAGRSESETLDHLLSLAARIRPADDRPSFLGGGVYQHYVPAVVDQLTSRGEFLTAYTPYQAEASQGTLQQIFEYQSMVCALTGLDVSNASHYDGATACAEAIAIVLNHTGRSSVLFSGAVAPAYREVARTYFRHLGVDFREVPAPVGTTDPDALAAGATDAACLVLQTPNAFGCVENMDRAAEIARNAGAVPIAVVNPVALALLRPPGECGFDIAVGDGQPLGNHASFGGPSFGFLAARQSFVREMPGRIVGETVDTDGRRAFVLTLQAREQHIRREKALSNICTNQALIALRAAIYLAGMGKQGMPALARQCVANAHFLEEKLAALPGVKRPHTAPFFHEFVALLPRPVEEINAALLERGFVGGADISDWAPDLENPCLFCTTERRTKDEMEAFSDALREATAPS